MMAKCIRCGHEPCPHCGNWCDTLLNKATRPATDGDGYVHPDDLDDYNEGGTVCCCDGECVYTEPSILDSDAVDILYTGNL